MEPSAESGPERAGALFAAADPVDVDVPTLVAVSTVAWAMANMLHEIVGHAGAALMFGIPVRAISTTTAYIEVDQIQSATQERIILMAATPVNLVTGALALWGLHRLTRSSPPLRYFLWLFSVFSFTIATWNLVSLPILGAGDWGDVANGLDAPGLWTALVLAIGWS